MAVTKKMTKKQAEAAEIAEITGRMADCIRFALRNFDNRTVYQPDQGKMTTWHVWFKETLQEAGFGEPK